MIGTAYKKMNPNIYAYAHPYTVINVPLNHGILQHKCCTIIEDFVV